MLEDLISNGVIPPSSPVASLLGGEPLGPERSVNHTAGVVLDTGPLTVTADYFRVAVSDRIGITANFVLTPPEAAVLEAEGVEAARDLRHRDVLILGGFLHGGDQWRLDGVAGDPNRPARCGVRSVRGTSRGGHRHLCHRARRGRSRAARRAGGRFETARHLLVPTSTGSEYSIGTTVARSARGGGCFCRHARTSAARSSEFVAAPGEENMRDWIGLAAERPDDVLVQRRMSLRLLRRSASSVLHQQFHETDIVTVHVDAPSTVAGGL